MARKRCLPCEGLEGPLTASAVKAILQELPGWQWERGKKRIAREFVCADFKAALALVKRIGARAEYHNHHPDLHLTRYRRLTVELTTHAVKGLTANDFILAAEIDRVWEKMNDA